MGRDEKQRAGEEPRELAGAVEGRDRDAAGKVADNDADEWDGTDDPAFYLKPSGEE